MNETEKLPLLAIRKFERPRCMKNVKSLPAVWKANRKARMTSQIFEEWVRKFDRKMLLQGRSVALIVDNCPAHLAISGLRAVQLIFLPPNTTSVLQPRDQGIIQTLKTHYRKRVLRKLIALIESHGDNKFHLKLTVLDVITMAAAAWDKVKPKTIENCFRHAGFVTSADTTTEPIKDTDAPERMEVEQLFSELKNAIPVEQSVDEYLAVDEKFQDTREEMAMEQIVTSVQDTPAVAANEDDDKGETPLQQVSTKSALEAVETLRHFLLQQENYSTLVNGLDSYESRIQKIATNSLRQKKITYFFTTN